MWSWEVLCETKLHLSCDIKRWESASTVWELSANFKGEWGNDDKSGDSVNIIVATFFI